MVDDFYEYAGFTGFGLTVAAATEQAYVAVFASLKEETS